MTRTDYTGRGWKDYVIGQRNVVVSKFNKLLKGDISVAQAHAERDEIVSIFNQLADELQWANDDRNKALVELRKTQRELKKLTENN